MHIDVNSAFLSWTAIDLMRKGHRDIRNEYAVISDSSNSRSGIVLAKSMLAKEKGIITGEPLYMARKKYLPLKVYKPDFKIYQDMSNQLFQYISQYTPDYEVFSIDECYIDYTKVQKLYGDVLSFALKLKKEIKEQLGFTVNIGIANNKLCAKMASDFKKPDQVHTLYQYEIKEKMWPLEVESLFGIGRKTASILKSIGICTIGDLAKSNPHFLYRYFKNRAEEMIGAANGMDYSKVESQITMSKGISKSITLEENVETIDAIDKVLESISNDLGLALRKEGRHAYIVSVQLKDYKFLVYSKQRKLKNPTNVTSELYQISKQLVREMWDEEPIRLIGIRLEHLVESRNYQLSLFDDLIEHQTNSILEDTIVKINQKYGEHMIERASLMEHKIRKK